MTNAPLPHDDVHSSLPQRLDMARKALAAARDDFARLKVRDFGRALQEAAVILNHKEIAIHAAELVQDAERAIAKANPHNPGGMGTSGKPSCVIHNNATQAKTAVSDNKLRQIRRAHQQSDEDYEQAKAEHQESGKPITRKALIDRRHHVTQNTGRVEWYTPPHIISAARKTMGGIDLDPATTVEANERLVRAEHILTAEDDALSPGTLWMPEWGTYEGRVWLNPPYRQPDVKEFSERLLEEIEAQTVVQAVWLSNNATETDWGQRLLRHAKAVCFPARRIRFLDQNFQPVNSPTQGQMLVGLGPRLDRKRFQNAFSSIGVIR